MKTTIVGTFPPPVHGMATVNQAVFERLLIEGWNVEKLDTTPPNVKTTFFSRLSRLIAFLPVWKYLLSNNLPNDRVYMALSGGWGQIYDIVTTLLCRMKGMKCILHHHSVAYLIKKRVITTILFEVAGKNAVHVVLCEKMKRSLQKRYRCERVIILSNQNLICSADPQPNRNKIQTIGYLSNITKEKGGLDIIRLAGRIRARNWPVKFKVAGPCLNDDLGKLLQKAHEVGDLEWIGPIYSKEKKAFLDSLDVFLFPTHYQNEAEPLVVWEALSSGVPVIAYDRGCIAGQIGDAGKFIPQDTDFVESSIELIDAWLTQPDVYRQYVEATQKRTRDVGKSAADQWNEFKLALEVGTQTNDNLSTS